MQTILADPRTLLYRAITSRHATAACQIRTSMLHVAAGVIRQAFRFAPIGMNQLTPEEADRDQPYEREMTDAYFHSQLWL